MSEQSDGLKKQDNQEFDSKTLTMLQNYIKSYVQIAQIGPLNSAQLQTVIASLIIQIFHDPHEVATRIVKTVHAHCQQKEVQDKFKDAPIIKGESVKEKSE